MSTTSRRRIARKTHHCEGTNHTSSQIKPGDVYLEHTEFPGSFLGFADTVGHPIRRAQCAVCATTHGLGYLLEPVPTEQAYRDGLVGMPT